jgi:hypothetical protein
MKKLFVMSMLAVTTFASAAFAAPNNLVVVNDISSTSTAYVRGTAAGAPIAAHSLAAFPWATVTAICNNTASMNATNVCALEIYAETNTATPVDVGTVVIYVDTGHLVALNRHNVPYQLHADDSGRITLSDN